MDASSGRGRHDEGCGRWQRPCGFGGVQGAPGRDRHKVLGTGTLLESARLTRFIDDLLEVSTASVNAWVVGEHGNSSVALVDNSRIMGLTLSEYLSAEVGASLDMNPEAVNTLIRERAFRIIAGKGFTSTGVAASAERVVSAIAGDNRDILPVSIVLDGEYGVSGFAISVPVLVGREGAIAVKQLPLSDADEALDVVGLSERKRNYPSQMSGGQQQRVSIARALVKNPKIILADEPTAALDYATSIEVLQVMEEVVKGGTTMVMVTHNEEITRMADRVVRMRDGRMHEVTINRHPAHATDLVW